MMKPSNRVSLCRRMAQVRAANDVVLTKARLPPGYDIKQVGGIFTAVLDEPSRHPVGPERKHAVEAVVDAWSAAQVQSPASDPVYGTWYPMESAPVDGTDIILLIASGGIRRESVFGHYDDDRHTKKPRPYWSRKTSEYVSEMRSNSPLAWMPLPSTDFDC